jgi:membrane associated rhomboid family serine protease
MLLADQNRLTRISLPWVTIAMIAACTLAFLVELGGTALPEALVFRPDLLAARPGDPLLWLGVPGHALLHGGFWHLLGNMLALWVFGDNVEDAFGHARFAAFLAACAAAGAAAFWLTTPAGIGLIGASGAIAGVMGSYLLLHPRARVAMLAFKGVPVCAPASWFVGFWLGGNLLHAAGAFETVGDGAPVAWFAHLGGFAAGMLLTLVARPADVALFQPGLAGDAEDWFWKRVWDLGPRDGEAVIDSAAAIGRALLFALLVGLALLFAS